MGQAECQFVARYRKSDMKPQCLWDHLESVAAMTSQFAGKIGLEAVGSLLGLTHDLGKATREFEEYLKYKSGLIDRLSIQLHGAKLDHSTAGAQALYEAFLQPDGTTSLAADLLAITVASHHGFMDALTPDGRDTLFQRLSKGESETRKEQALSSLPPHIKERIRNLVALDINRTLTDCLQRSVEGVYGEDEAHFNIGLIVRFLLSCLIDADRIDAADSEQPENRHRRQLGQYTDWDVLIASLEDYISGFQMLTDMDTLRTDVSNKCLAMAKEKRGFFRLTVPTGGGKTLASLRFALHHAKKHELQRIVYVIPYTSIIDQNAKSIRGTLGIDPKDTRIVLEHHSNLLPDQIADGEDAKEEAQDEYNDYKLLAENWDSPIILTTMVQFLETLYGAGTNSCRRMHQLANSVIIFDEIQTLPVNLVHLFNLAAKFLVNACNASVMLCTATQPILHEVNPKTRALPFDSKREVRVTKEQRRQTLDRVDLFDVTRPQGWSQHEIAELAVAECNGEKSVLIIVNTKQDARNIFRQLQAMAETPVYHLSTNMCPAHRIETLRIITELLDPDQGKPFLLVSTQLIEAGVDVDFDVVIRSLAGIDSIAQAAGRCNRHGRKPFKGRVLIVNSSDENLNKLPSISVAQEAARRVLIDFERDAKNVFQRHLLSDSVLETYFRYHFHEEERRMSYPVDSKSPVGRSDTLVELLARNRISIYAYGRNPHNPKLSRFLNQSFQTAARSFEVIANSGQGVLVPFDEGRELISDLCGVFEPSKQYDVLRRAQRYSVNCFSHELDTLAKAGGLHEVQESSGIFYVDGSHYHPELGLTLEKSNKMETQIC